MGWISDMFGGGEEEATKPTMENSLDEWIALLPKLMSTQQQYAPQEAQLQYDMFSQYAPQYAQVQSDIYKQQYPTTYGLQELLAQQATEGSTGELTESERRQFLDLQKSLVGEQSTAGIGTDYIGSNLLNYVQGRKQQNQNLGLSLLGKIPMTQIQSPSYSNMFGTSANSLLGTSMQYPQFQAQFASGNTSGNQLGSLLGAGAGAAIGTMIMPGIGTTIGAGLGGQLGGSF